MSNPNPVYKSLIQVALWRDDIVSDMQGYNNWVHISKISNSHGGDYEDLYLLDCDAVYTDKYLRMFPGIKLHGTTPEKIVIQYY
jgi:hypothetical protein